MGGFSLFFFLLGGLNNAQNNFNSTDIFFTCKNFAGAELFKTHGYDDKFVRICAFLSNLMPRYPPKFFAIKLFHII